MFVTVQHELFCQQTLYDQLRDDCAKCPGAIVTFTGLVRDYNAQGPIDGLELEHYPGMTEQVMHTLANQASSTFKLTSAGIVHRVGRLHNAEPIVWVGCAAAHRQAAFDAASYIMDTLKQAVPLWKKEFQDGQAHWVAAKASDRAAAQRWLGTATDDDKSA